MRLTSPSFDYGRTIPRRHTCHGDELSPQLRISEIPDGTAALALIMEDPDAPRGTWYHWVAYDIAPVAEIPEGTEPPGVAGVNSWGRTGYGGPCPPAGIHRYVIRVWALPRRLGLPERAPARRVEQAIGDGALASAALMGRYGR